MRKEDIKIKTSRGIEGTYDIETGIDLLMNRGLRLGHIFSDGELPFIVSKKESKSMDHATGKESIKRFMVVAYVYNLPKIDKDKYAGFMVYEDDTPKSFKRCLDNLEVLDNG